MSPNKIEVLKSISKNLEYLFEENGISIEEFVAFNMLKYDITRMNYEDAGSKITGLLFESDSVRRLHNICKNLFIFEGSSNTLDISSLIDPNKLKILSDEFKRTHSEVSAYVKFVTINQEDFDFVTGYNSIKIGENVFNNLTCDVDFGEFGSESLYVSFDNNVDKKERNKVKRALEDFILDCIDNYIEDIPLIYSDGELIN